MSYHENISRINDDDDKVIAMIKRTGCLDYHNLVQECMFEHKDWRTCKSAVEDFKNCMDDYQKRKQLSESRL